jgi:hypothetical protein
VLFLASDESRTFTGTQLTIDHGATKSDCLVTTLIRETGRASVG